MKRTLLCMLAAILAGVCFQAEAQSDTATLYFSTEKMPNLIKCLPPPPDTIGTDFANDIMRYMWGKTQRSDKVRTAIAVHDAVWNLDSLFAAFTVPFGLEVSKEKTPEIYKLLFNSLSTIDQTRPHARRNDESVQNRP